MFILARINNYIGNTNSHSLFTDISTLNLTYFLYIHRDTRWIHFIYLTKTMAERRGTLII